MRFKPGDKARATKLDGIEVEILYQKDGYNVCTPDGKLTCWIADNDLEPIESPDYNARNIILCPKCHGQGIVSKPPWVPGDINEWSGTSISYVCNVCNGAKVLPIEQNDEVIATQQAMPQGTEAGIKSESPVQEEERRVSFSEGSEVLQEEMHTMINYIMAKSPKLAYQDCVNAFLLATISNLRKEIEELKKQKI